MEKGIIKVLGGKMDLGNGTWVRNGFINTIYREAKNGVLFTYVTQTSSMSLTSTDGITFIEGQRVEKEGAKADIFVGSNIQPILDTLFGNMSYSWEEPLTEIPSAA